jgi:formimidoylglutamate deiminase
VRLIEVEHLHQPGGWASPGCLEIDDDGVVVAVHVAPPRGRTPDERIGGYGIPGVPNLHSHGFQRALAGRAEVRDPGEEDNLWTWRREMYRFVGRLDPEALQDITALAYLELVRAGFTQVGEFHYVHRDPDGRRYQDLARTSWSVVEAAREVGIGLTLLPVLYRHAGIGRPLAPEQMRFELEPGEVLEVARRARDLGDPLVTAGVAAHSLRAVSIDEIRALQDGWPATPNGPIHIHAAERPEEVAECLEGLGARPVRALVDRVGLDGRWCVVHATHVDTAEVAALAASRVVVALCPMTEATVADGLFPLLEYERVVGRWGIGTDSHYTTDPALELRCLELGQRLRHGRRSPLPARTDAELHPGRLLLDRALAAGPDALGVPIGDLTPGRRADLVVLNPEDPILAGHGPTTALDAWVLSGAATPVRDVMVAGRWVVRDGRHPAQESIEARYRATILRLLDT